MKTKKYNEGIDLHNRLMRPNAWTIRNNVAIDRISWVFQTDARQNVKNADYANVHHEKRKRIIQII